MSLSAATLELLMKAGLAGESLLEVARSIEADAIAKSTSSGAERQRRYRERKASRSDVTRDVTGDPSPRDARVLPLPPSPQTPQPPTPAPGVCSTRARGDGFAGFWSAYPRKVGKPLAEKAYAKALARCTGPDPPAAILAGLTAHLPSWAETEPDLVPHPTTWLNRDGWNDQPPQPRRPRLVHDRPDHDPAQSRRDSRNRSWAGVFAEERGEAVGDGP